MQEPMRLPVDCPPPCLTHTRDFPLCITQSYSIYRGCEKVKDKMQLALSRLLRPPGHGLPQGYLHAGQFPRPVRHDHPHVGLFHMPIDIAEGERAVALHLQHGEQEAQVFFAQAMVLEALPETRIQAHGPSSSGRGGWGKRWTLKVTTRCVPITCCNPRTRASWSRG